MKPLPESPSADRTPALRVVTAAHSGIDMTIAADSRTGKFAAGHPKPLLSIVTSAEPALVEPSPLYRRLAWRYWLLAIAAGLVFWWAILTQV